ncbi:MAG: Fe-S cluster assembly scaffold protein NifU [Candidatus Micrarchaeota archaeon]|nr:Fe-S cluster assembly scaffold protein NifU [Candidatus Micrarchaeota archaeon]
MAKRSKKTVKNSSSLTNSSLYTQKVMEHFMNPHNMGEIEDADSVGEAGNAVCGDVMYLYLKIEKNRIKDIKFKTLGCAAAIATSSMVTDMAKGKTLDEALKITNKQVAEKLGGLPAIKMHCSVLAQQALKNAIENYLKRNLKK